MSSENDRYLSEDEFCEQFKIAPRTAQRWRQTGDGPKWVRIGKRFIRYRQGDAREWVKAHTFEHRADELQRAG
ncbi:MAG: helix-turn-helix domain-containing protein [Beijerinckiaceae bacterium]|jgi:predicted DNA-binding transcriptional regulator AlpA